MLRISTISFPGLGIGEFDINSVAFELFGRPVAWYGLIITIGMICAVIYTVVQAKKIGVTVDDIIDYALFTIPIGVIGARLYYVIFDNENTYETLYDVFNIAGGGLAIYGGIIAGTLTVLCVSLVKKISFFAFGDSVAPAVLLAQGIGRWGNFANGEAFGSQTDWFCRMGLKNVVSYHTFGTTQTVYVHPTFLYESIWNLIGVLGVYLFAKKIGKKYDGQLILLTFGWYGFGRFFIEGLRSDSLYIGETGIRVSQGLAALVFLVLSGLLIYFAIKPPKRPLYCKEFPIQNDVTEVKSEIKTEGKPDSLVEFKKAVKSFFKPKYEMDTSNSTKKKNYKKKK